MRFRESSSESLCRWAATCSGVRSFRAVAGACAAACCSSIDLLSQPRATNVDYTQWAITLTGEAVWGRSEEHTSELQSQSNLVCRLLLEKKKKKGMNTTYRDKQ